MVIAENSIVHYDGDSSIEYLQGLSRKFMLMVLKLMFNTTHTHTHTHIKVFSPPKTKQLKNYDPWQKANNVKARG